MSLHSATTLRELQPLNLAAVAAGARRPVVLLQTVGKEVAVALQRHFKSRDGEGNKRGWPSHHFWRKVANKTSHQNATADGVTVTVASREFVHKITGGKVVPKEKENLALPLTAEAYASKGKGTIRESFPGLFVIRTRKGAYLVRGSQENRGQSREKGARRQKARGVQRERLEFLFRLTKSVTHKADPRALPPEGAIPAAIDRAIASYTVRNEGRLA